MKNENDYQKKTHCQPALAARLWQELSDAGYSKTRPRRFVVDTMSSAEGGLSPAQIMDCARERQVPLGLVTVYRTLEILCQLGLARRIHREDGCHSYALAEREHSHHLICKGCHQVVEFDCGNLDGLMERVHQQTGYEIQEHWIELLGLCPRCKVQQDAV